MTELKQLREQIDRIDGQILKLLNQRAEVVLKVAGAKSREKLELYDPLREEEICQRLERESKGPFPGQAIRPVFREIISASLSLQKPMYVAYLGPQATFTHLACMQKFGLSAQFVAVRGIEDVFGAVERGRSNYGVVPVENSTEGIVSHTLDMFVESDLKICAEILLSVSHCLVSRAEQLKGITKVYSHHQPVAQSRRWLREHLPGVEIIEVGSTAQAAELAGGDPASAAIASEMAAKLYNLNIISDRIEDASSNFTRFLVIGKTSAKKCGVDKTSIMFSIKDRIGALHAMLDPFAKYQVNLTKIESRPSRRKPWDYIFYVDMQGHLEDPPVKAALDDLERETLRFKILGSYPVGSLE